MLTPWQKRFYAYLGTASTLTGVSIVNTVLLGLRFRQAYEYNALQLLPTTQSMVAKDLRYDVSPGACSMDYLNAMSNSWECFKKPYLQNEYGKDCQFPDASLGSEYYSWGVYILPTFMSILTLIASLSALWFTWYKVADQNWHSDGDPSKIGLLSFLKRRPYWPLLFLPSFAFLLLIPLFANPIEGATTSCLALTTTLDSACQLLSPINVTDPARFFPECRLNATTNGTYPLFNISGTDIPNQINFTPTPTANPRLLFLIYYIFSNLAGMGTGIVIVLLGHLAQNFRYFCPRSITQPAHNAEDDFDDDVIHRTHDTDDYFGDDDVTGTTPLKRSQRAGYATFTSNSR